MTTRVWLTGQVTLEAAGLLRERDLPGRQGRLAFAALCLARRRGLAVEELAERIWADEPPAAWPTALRAVVSKTRTALDRAGLDAKATLTATSGCYHLVLPPGTWVDVEAAADAVHHAETEPAESAVPWARVALSCTNAPFLPGEDAGWVVAERERLTDLRVRALDRLAVVWVDRGEPAFAVRDAAEAVRLRPYRDSGCRLLMRAHVAAGDPAEALRVYERYRRLLAAELGVDPDRETRDLHAALLRT